MSVRLVKFVLILILLASSAGCRVFADRGTGWKDAISDERLQGPGRRLNHDVWKSNPRWSPLAQLPDSPWSDGSTGRQRWIYPKLDRALAAAEKENLISALERRACVQRQVTVPERARLANFSDRELQDLFSALSQHDDLKGWNAAILWAQYDPVGAAPIAERLEKLVEKPPSYRVVAYEDEDQDDPRDPQKKPDLGANARRRPPMSEWLPISPNMQAAAASAWCEVLGAQSGDPELALAPAGRMLSKKNLLPNVREELVRGIARRVAPDRIPGMADMLGSVDAKKAVSVEGQLAAIDACLIHAVALRAADPAGEQPAPTTSRSISNDDPQQLAALAGEVPAWPAEIWGMRHHDDPRIRSRFGEFVATTKHPGAVSILQGQINDADPHVREAAFMSLGLLGSPSAFEELEKQAKRPDELVRAHAIRGLSIDRPARLASFASDTSPRVRIEIARGLSRHPGGESSRLLGEMLVDQSLEVQSVCIQSLEFWPDEPATLLLLQALTTSSLRTRTAALEALESRRGGGLSFPLRAGPQERALRVAQWTREWHLPDASLARVRELTQTGSPQLNQARFLEARDRLASIVASGPQALQLAGDWAAELVADDVPILEQILVSAEPAESELLLENVLPRLSPAYAALVQLQNSDVAIRRAGAQQIGRLGQDSSLSPTVMEQVTRRMRAEQDTLVWRLVMQGVLPDGSEIAGQAALLALNSHWPDIRALGCQYVGHHGQIEQGPWLLPLLFDSSRVVQTAAVTAAGQCHNAMLLDGIRAAEGQPDLPGLRKLLRESDGNLRYLVVVSMSRLGDPVAMDELARLAFDPSSTMRLEIVQTLGTSGQTRFIEPLVRLAWTETQPHVRQAALDSLLKLVPEGEHPARLKQARNPTEAVEIWTAWWEDRRRKRPEEKEGTDV